MSKLEEKVKSEHPVRLVVAHHSAILRRGVSQILEAEEDMEVVGEASDLLETRRCVRDLTRGVLLIGFDMLGPDFIENIAALTRKNPQMKVLLFMDQYNEDIITDSMQAGAMGYLLGEANWSQLIEAIRIVNGGDAWMERRIILKILEKCRRDFKNKARGRRRHTEPRLTEAETEVMKLIITGKTNRAVAEELAINERTVKAHLTKIYKKLGLRNRTELTLYALGDYPQA